VTPHYPDVQVQLSGKSGNVFNVICSVSLALRRAGRPVEADEFLLAVERCESYDAVLRLAMRTVDVH